jgi:uncharacterized LabA/DUF88 family protein
VAYVGSDNRGLRQTLQASGFDTVNVGETREGLLVQLCVDAMALSTRVDTLVLASADEDLEPLAKYLRSSGLKVEFACFGNDLQALRQTVGEEPLSLGREAVILP